MEQLLESKPKKGMADSSRKLYDAAWVGDFNEAFDALDDGADLSKCFGNSSLTAVHVAARTGNKNILHIILNKGPSLEARSSSGETPLFGAVKEKHVGTTQMLVDAKAEVNAQDVFGKTPLSIAKEFEMTDFIEFLEARGAK